MYFYSLVFSSGNHATYNIYFTPQQGRFDKPGEVSPDPL